MKNSYVYFAVIPMVIMTILSACNRVDESESNFDNVAYIQQASEKSLDQLIIKPSDTIVVKTIQSSLALPHDKDVNVTFKVDFSLVNEYNTINEAKCEPLEADFFEFTNTKALIVAGNVRSTDLSVNFKNLKNLPLNRTFLLPITIANVDELPILKGSKTVYYLLKKGAPIVMAANIHDTFLELVDKSSTTLRDRKSTRLNSSH